MALSGPEVQKHVLSRATCMGAAWRRMLPLALKFIVFRQLRAVRFCCAAAETARHDRAMALVLK